MNRTLLERARSIRLQAGMPEGLWAEAVNHAAYLINRSPSTAIDLQTPEEIWRGEAVDYSTLRIFGCPAYSLVDSHKKTSWRRNQENANLLVSPQGSRDSDSGILRQVLHSLAEMWSLMRSRCCRYQRRKVNRRVEIQLVQQILSQREWSSWRLLIHQGRIPEQMETLMRLLRSNLDR